MAAEQRHPPRVLRGVQRSTAHTYLQLVGGLLKIQNLHIITIGFVVVIMNDTCRLSLPNILFLGIFNRFILS